MSPLNTNPWQELMTETEPNNRRWIVAGAVIAALLLLFILGWIPRMENTKRIDELAGEDSLPKVNLLKLIPNKKPDELFLPTSAQGWHATPIWSRVNGYLTRYLVDIGDVVKKGDLLAEIDTPETDEELAQAKADLVSAIAERDIAKISANRWDGLWEKNREAVSKQEVDQFDADLKSKEALVVANEKNVARLTYLQQFKNIYAPFDGIITNRLIDIGSLIFGAVNTIPEELFSIEQTGVIRFYTDVPQTYFRQIKDGLKAEVTVQEIPGKVFKGVVARYAKGLDPLARTMLTEVDVENPEGLLYSGVYGTLKFTIYPDTVNFIIPTSAVIIRSGYPHVAVVDESRTVHLKRVEIGRDHGKEMEIICGLKEGENIVTIASDRIRDGVKVEIVNQN